MYRTSLLGDAGVAAWAYRTAPRFWRQYAADRRRAILPAPLRPDPSLWDDDGIHAAWLGHSTVLLKIAGATVLTDPVFSARAGLNLRLFTLGIKRLVAPALSLSELPKLDLVLLSHAHFDHFDIPSLRAIENRGTTVVTASKTADLLRVKRWREVRELRWEEHATVGPLEIQAFRVNHWGARMQSDTYRGYNGYAIRSGRYQVIFAGDTALTDSFRQLRSTRPFDLAIMPVGAYNPWIHYHCTPEQALQMANDADADFVLPVHHQTFALSREPYREPIERLRRATAANIDRIAVERIGQEFHRD